MSNTITSWRTKKNENGTFTSVCFQFQSCNEINEQTGNYTTPSKILWSGTYATRAKAKANAVKAVKSFR
jgi:hypothetical protein